MRMAGASGASIPVIIANSTPCAISRWIIYAALNFTEMDARIRLHHAGFWPHFKAGLACEAASLRAQLTSPDNRGWMKTTRLDFARYNPFVSCPALRYGGTQIMLSVVGIFRSLQDATQAVARLRAIPVPADNINVLSPGPADQEQRELAQVPLSEAEIGRAHV